LYLKHLCHHLLLSQKWINHHHAGINNIFKENGRDVLHLPLCYHCLNAIEVVWGDIKNRVAQECMSVNLKEMQTFCKKVFAEYTKGKCQNCCSHMKKTDEESWKRDGLMDEAISSMITHLRE
jgi:hypothetical protein